MKKISTLLGILIITLNVLAQAPEKMSYQFIVRNNNGILVTTNTVSVRISILQSTPNGIAVYAEKHLTTTSINGLANLEIGGGTPINGTFSAIDWASGPYFLKTETDPEGGSNYSISGTSQLLSVPYALYAKTAESISGGILEADPVFSASPANGISTANITDWTIAYGWGDHVGLYKSINYTPSWNEITNNPFLFSAPASDQLIKFNGTNWINFTPDFASTNHTHADATTTISGFMSGIDKTKLDGLQNADGSETKVTAGTDISVSGTGTTPDPYVISSTTGSGIYHQGDLTGGGVVFFVDPTGQHGLICSLIDMSTDEVWSNIVLQIGPTAQSTWDGQSNTTAIVGQAGMTNSAAKLCNDYTNDDYGTGIYSDWYLPANQELFLLNEGGYNVNLAILNSGNSTITPLALAYYWSSTEINDSQVWCNFLILGSPYAQAKPALQHVRAIRAF
ncbi:MAG: hypothetical protein Q8O72_04015 [Bacteroidales bacterium]|nr:hypothetical protein [Bacteroidales bacterium]